MTRLSASVLAAALTVCAVPALPSAADVPGHGALSACPNVADVEYMTSGIRTSVPHTAEGRAAFGRWMARVFDICAHAQVPPETRDWARIFYGISLFNIGQTPAEASKYYAVALQTFKSVATTTRSDDARQMAQRMSTLAQAELDAFRGMPPKTP